MQWPLHMPRVKLAIKIAPIVAMILAAIFSKPASSRAEGQIERYLSPIEMALSHDGQRLYVVCEGTGEVRVIDVNSATVAARVAVGSEPRGITSSPDGS